jgi:UDP-GlcNAc3NAcA epimerase
LKKIITIVGARPQFIKLAPLSIALKAGGFKEVSIHTGQHYDQEMSDVFFKELNIPEPSYKLTIGSATHGKQTGEMLQQIEAILIDEKPDAVVVFGDTNTTLAGALAAAKLGILLVHIESGLRSYNKSMPEEINRVLTDHSSDILLAPTPTAINNLAKEGITKNVYNVGDIMQDSLNIGLEYLAKHPTKFSAFDFPYVLATIHRNYNTDDLVRLISILTQLNKLGKKVIFPIHPRTKNKLLEEGFDVHGLKELTLTSPLGYFSFLATLKNCEYLITDSGGVQKEAYMIKKPCVTVRYETEWVETLKGGWNTLLGNDINNLSAFVPAPSEAEYTVNLYGDGSASTQIVSLLTSKLYDQQ